MKLWEILVPYEMDGKTVHIYHHHTWDDFVRGISGGLTIFKLVKGQWEEPGTKVIYKEKMIPVRIACSRKKIKKIGKFTKKHYNQLKVMIYKISKEVIEI